MQVVPLTLPPGVLFNTTEDHNVPWGRGDCVAAGTRGTRCLDPASAPAGAMVCYPVDFDMFPAPEISQKWHVAADDPRDGCVLFLFVYWALTVVFRPPDMKETVGCGGVRFINHEEL